jgi:hypothetical protein
VDGSDINKKTASKGYCEVGGRRRITRLAEPIEEKN